MHIRNYCLCSECIARLVDDDAETRIRARIAIACTGPATGTHQKLSDGVVKRVRRV